jgi:hypothetical protein
MGDDAFFRVETGVNQWQLIGSDGTNVDIRTGLPAGFAAGPGTGGHVWRSDLNGAHWVWSGTIPNPADPPVPATVPYVFSRDTSPLGVAAAFKSYDLPATETLSAVNTPANSSIYLVEDLED